MKCVKLLKIASPGAIIQRAANTGVVKWWYGVAIMIGFSSLVRSSMTPRILIVEDDEGLRQMWRLAFNLAGFEVLEAASGSEALARAFDSSPTLVLLDVMMPGLDGFDVCRQLRYDQRTHRLPIVFVSALSDIKQRNALLKLGADACVSKPVGPRELIARIREVMERHGYALYT